MELPRDLAYVWAWYQELNACRQPQWHGLEGIGRQNNRTVYINRYRLPRFNHHDILAWATTTRRDPNGREVRLMLRVDQAVLDVVEGRDLPPAKPETVREELKGALRMFAGKKPGQPKRERKR